MATHLPPTLHVDATASTPLVHLDASLGECTVEGRSMPEDPAEFYTPFLHWLEAYATRPATATKFVFKVDYFDTASCPYFMRLIRALQQIPKPQIYWHYHPDDEVIFEAGELFALCAKVPFHLVACPDVEC